MSDKKSGNTNRPQPQPAREQANTPPPSDRRQQIPWNVTPIEQTTTPPPRPKR